MEIKLTLIHTMALGLVILFLGHLMNAKIKFLKNNNIPEPVVGGICFALINWFLFSSFNISFQFDMTLKNPLMLAFFTTVGLGASFRMLVKGGPKVILFLAIATVLLVIQNSIGVFIAWLTDLNPLSGLIAGSITLSGGHGTGATYADMFSQGHNLQGVFELAMASATFGLILGGLIGGPVARKLISKNQLSPDDVIQKHDVNFRVQDTEEVTPKKMLETLLIIALCLSIGGIIFDYFTSINIPLPSFICPLLIGIVVTNLGDYTKKFSVNRDCVDLWGTMALSLFLAMALMSLKIWELLNLAGPMLLILLVQTLVMILFAYFITFRLMGADYHAAIMAGGHCGFGLGATPTAVANMESLVERYGASPQAFLVVPMVGAFFIDIANTFVLQLFLAFPFLN